MLFIDEKKENSGNQLSATRKLKCYTNSNMTQKNNPNAMKRRSRIAIFALVAPAVLSMSSLALLIVINLIFNPTFWMVGDTDPVNPTPLVIAVLNWILLATGAIGLLSLVPGAVAGLFLLARTKHDKKRSRIETAVSMML